MTTEARVKSLHHDSKRHKEHEWKEHGLRDSPSVCAAKYGDSQRVVDYYLPSAMSVLNMTGVPYTMASLILGIGKSIFEGGDVPDEMAPYEGEQIESLILRTDGYCRPHDDLPDDYEHGEMELDFKSNPASDVSEVVTTYLFERTATGLNLGSAVSFYTIGDGGKIEWQETDVDVSELDDGHRGEIVEAVKALFSVAVTS